MSNIDNVLDNCCPFCGKEGEEDDTLLEEVSHRDYIIIFKCKRCGKLYGYKESYVDSDDGNPLDETDNQHSLKTIITVQKEGRGVFSAAKCREIARALKKSKKREKSPSDLIDEKKSELKTAGVGSLIVAEANRQANSYIESKGPCTQKQLNSLLVGAILSAQDALIRRGDVPEKEITERKLEKIFRNRPEDNEEMEKKAK